MKRFGGMEFLSQTDGNSYYLLNTTLIDQITNFINRINQSGTLIDSIKIASLFEINPPQASVRN
jgi:hypothetical protein